MKILIVEDESNLRETIYNFLKEENYVCEKANNYRIASEKLISNIFL